MMRYRKLFLAPALAGLLIFAPVSSIAYAQNAGAPFALDASLNLAWVLVCGFLVMFMQVGFAMLETGFTRARNAVNTMAMNLVIYPVGLIGFWFSGYALMMGGVSNWPSLGASPIPHRELSITVGAHQYGLIGCAKFALVSIGHDPGSLAMFLFAVVFMDT